MIELPLPERVERELIETAVRTVPALRGRPEPAVDNGIVVVMVSGFFGTKEDFRELLSLLAEAGFRGWAYDYCGQLGLQHGAVSATIAQMADDLVAVVRAVSAGQPAHVIGHCLGGFVARSAVLQQPDLARSLTLVGCGPSMGERKHQSTLSGLAQIHANGGTIALWPLVKTLLAKDDTIMREFWHTKLATMKIFVRLIRPTPLADPYPLYARLRDTAPFLPVRFPACRPATWTRCGQAGGTTRSPARCTARWCSWLGQVTVSAGRPRRRISAPVSWRRSAVSLASSPACWCTGWPGTTARST